MQCSQPPKLFFKGANMKVDSQTGETYPYLGSLNLSIVISSQRIYTFPHLQVLSESAGFGCHSLDKAALGHWFLQHTIIKRNDTAKTVSLNITFCGCGMISICVKNFCMMVFLCSHLKSTLTSIYLIYNMFLG